MIVENVITGLKYMDREPKNAQGSFECFYALECRSLPSKVRHAVELAVLNKCYVYHWEAYANLNSYMGEGWTVERWAYAHARSGNPSGLPEREGDLAKP